ncbi:MAG: OmpA family protein [Defluviicoccus sp.]|nr:OmpA family protein [Defluviicoccus sp.]MDG4610412.1 OmpA family protein [Defluviicoccus sp.]
MHAQLKMAAVALALLASTGCTNRYLAEAQSAQPQGTAFDRALASDYLALAEVEYQQGDQRDGDTYARRSIDAAKGKPTQPDEPGLRHIRGAEVAEVTAARQRLVKALDGNGRTTKPDVAARAQSLYDCWLEQLDENLQKDHIAACRDGFKAALAQLEAAPVAAKPVAPMAAPEKFLVFFDFAKSNLTTDAKNTIAKAAKVTGPARLIVVGHTDRAGPEDYNLRLSKRRADAVKAELVRLGVPANQITAEGRGEADPLVPTADGVREAQNRRVEITHAR